MSTRVNVTLKEEHFDQLEELAAIEGVPKTQVATDGVVAHLKAARNAPDYPEKLRAHIEKREAETAALQKRLAKLAPNPEQTPDTDAPSESF